MGRAILPTSSYRTGGRRMSEKKYMVKSMIWICSVCDDFRMHRWECDCIGEEDE